MNKAITNKTRQNKAKQKSKVISYQRQGRTMIKAKQTFLQEWSSVVRDCKERDKVKFATATLARHRALTWFGIEECFHSSLWLHQLMGQINSRHDRRGNLGEKKRKGEGDRASQMTMTYVQSCKNKKYDWGIVGNDVQIVVHQKENFHKLKRMDTVE
ncbi:hypothetical protein Tco_0694862 [Tanacetum coccineum]